MNRENPGLTLKDEVIDSYGTFTPLLTFYDIKSRCPPSESSPSNVDDTSELYDDDFEPDENAVIPPNVLKSRQRWTSTKGKPVLSAHPYIITRCVVFIFYYSADWQGVRSFIGVADMTKLFNRLAYDNVHNRIRSLSVMPFFFSLFLQPNLLTMTTSVEGLAWFGDIGHMHAGKIVLVLSSRMGTKKSKLRLLDPPGRTTDSRQNGSMHHTFLILGPLGDLEYVSEYSPKCPLWLTSLLGPLTCPC